MKVGVPRETAAGESRVAIVPETVAKLAKAGLEVLVEKDAGRAALFADEAYAKAGARLVDGGEALLGEADIVLKVDPPTVEEAGHLKEGAAVFSFLQSWSSGALLAALNARRVTAFSMEQIPRISRAQSMDVLSSQATIAGYKAVLLAANRLPRVLPMLVTAAGTLAPAKVLVLGAGVAGLMAISTARRMGAVVEGFDVRLAAAEQVESLGAKFIGKELLGAGAEGAGGYAKELAADAEARNRELIKKHAAENSVVISTAAIPKKKAPLLIPEDTVKAMKPGSVIVDLAAETGGNCALTVPGEEVVVHGVTILGPRKLPATLPTHASQMYSRNIATLLLSLIKNGALVLDFKDEVVAAACVTHGGETRSAL
ncbi:MAG: Re/Si-specific NAD(P)(+) transhydrogenase subunit alpha [Planctomycetes bacterium]|nr:Re/Si-specific NAD(P)(+) transhydrogenase subunit alpha [Planctomycetota bacterium]